MTSVHEGITRYRIDLKRFAISLVGSHRRADADDLVQDCLLRALEKAHQFQPGTNLKAWLFTLMRSIFITERRHDQVCRRHAEGVARGPSMVTQPVQYVHVMLRETARAIGKLDRRDIVYIRELAIGDIAHETLADRLQVPVGTVKSRLSRIRGKLRGAMDLDKSSVTSSLTH